MSTQVWKLTRLGFALVLGPMAFLAAPSPMVAQEPGYRDDSSYQGEAPERYAQVRRVEGDVRIRKGEVEENLDRGVPVGEGDTIVSRGRGVLQLGDGTRVAFASGTTFQVGALFTSSKGERQVLLRLDQGRLRIALGGESDARVRVDTPSGTAAMLDRGNATIMVEGDRSVRLKVHSGHLTFTTDNDQARINAGERITVYSRTDRLDRIGSFNTYEADSFDLWGEKALEVRRSGSWDRVPREVRYYADDLDDNGDWVDVPDTGWCWRPRVTVVDWRPYWQGRWGCYGGGMTWVSDEPWGYLTYHFGRWGWSAGIGWYWAPGVYYSPAWVAWNWGSGYCGWAPLNYWNYPCSWGYGAWGGYHCWNVIQVNQINVRSINTYVRADRSVIASFSGGTGTTTWNPNWRRAPIIATQAEFRNPAQMGRAFDRQVAHDRFNAYERAAQASTGRAVYRRDLAPGSGPQAGPGQGRGPALPFEDRGRLRGSDRPVLRDPGVAGRGTTPPPPPADRGRATEPGRDRAPAAGDRRGTPLPGPMPPRGNETERRPDPAPRERPRDERGRDFFGEERRPAERPRTEDRRPAEPTRREDRPAPREERPVPREDRPRYEPPPRREDRPAPREDRPSPREDRGEPRRMEAPRERPSEPSRPREDRPAPSHSAPPPSAPSRPSNERGGNPNPRR